MAIDNIEFIDYSDDSDYTEVIGENKTIVRKVGYSFYLCPACQEPLYVKIYIGVDYISNPNKFLTYVNDDYLRLHTLEHRIKFFQ